MINCVFAGQRRFGDTGDTGDTFWWVEVSPGDAHVTGARQ